MTHLDIEQPEMVTRWCNTTLVDVHSNLRGSSDWPTTAIMSDVAEKKDWTLIGSGNRTIHVAGIGRSLSDAL